MNFICVLDYERSTLFNHKTKMHLVDPETSEDDQGNLSL